MPSPTYSIPNLGTIGCPKRAQVDPRRRETGPIRGDSRSPSFFCYRANSVSDGIGSLADQLLLVREGCGLGGHRTIGLDVFPIVARLPAQMATQSLGTLRSKLVSVSGSAWDFGGHAAIAGTSSPRIELWS